MNVDVNSDNAEFTRRVHHTLSILQVFQPIESTINVKEIFIKHHCLFDVLRTCANIHTRVLPSGAIAID